MDPNLFHLDWERTFEVLATIVVLSIFVERALALVFEQRWFLEIYKRSFRDKGLKEVISFVVSFLICAHWDFDAVSMIILTEKVNTFGQILTATVIAGGSKGSIKLFRDVLGFKSQAYKEYEAAKAANS